MSQTLEIKPIISGGVLTIKKELVPLDKVLHLEVNLERIISAKLQIAGFEPTPRNIRRALRELDDWGDGKNFNDAILEFITDSIDSAIDVLDTETEESTTIKE